MEEKKRLSEVAMVFFKLGCTAFGGPAVHIAMMEEEIVRKRKWITPQHFLDLIGATNLIPGPNSTEMTMHCGQERAGWKGLVVAGVCFIFPAVILTGILAWAYQNYGKLPEVQPFIYGIKPAIIAVIVALMITLGKKALKSLELGIIGIVAAILVVLGFSEIGVLFSAGFLGIVLQVVKNKFRTTLFFIPLLYFSASESLNSISNTKLFFIFLKIGAILYGSGYVLFAFLEDELVSNEVLSRQVLIDAIAVGQFTPGPVFSSATFIGWQLGGFVGAATATAGIFLPSFLFVAFLNPLIPWLRKSVIMSSFLDCVNVASVAIILAVVFELGRDTFTDWRTIVIAVLGFVITYFFAKLNTAYIIFGGAILGYLLLLV